MEQLRMCREKINKQEKQRLHGWIEEKEDYTFDLICGQIL